MTQYHSAVSGFEHRPAGLCPLPTGLRRGTDPGPHKGKQCLATNLSFPPCLQRIVLQKYRECLTFSAHGGGSGSIQVSPCEICGEQSGTATGFSSVLQFSPVSVIPPMLHTHLHLHVAFSRRTNGGSLGTFRNTKVCRKSRSVG
jgi:hypothetical protein